MPSVVFPEILGLISASTFRRHPRGGAGSVYPAAEVEGAGD